MRARSALGLAALLAASMALAALPAPEAGLEGHSVAVQFSAQLRFLLDRVAGEEESFPPGILPPVPAAPPGAGSGPMVEVHFLAGERSWSVWVPVVGGLAVDLDGDGAPELHAQVDQLVGASLTLAGVQAAPMAWAAWIEEGEARWGLAGAGMSPKAAMVGLRDGELRVRVEGVGSAWHAAFAFAGKAQRTLAWLTEPDGPRGFQAAVGEGFLLRTTQPGKGGLRTLLLDDARSHDLTLRGAPAEARVVRDAQGALHYRAPEPGGALAARGDASPIGQRGDLELAVAPLPDSLTVKPDGDGFTLEASRPTDVLLDWKPPGDEGLRVVGNGVERLEARPGPSGGILVGGPVGRIAVQRPLPSGALAGEGGAVVDLGAQGALVVGAPSPWGAAATAVLLAGVVGWASVGARLRSGPRP